jgi:hypothetical protein
MRTLNRPMFRYGGPIKEGVMSGIREPKKNGGLSKQFNTGLVGDERYPKTDGREHHVAFIPPLLAAGSAALRFAPAAWRGLRAAKTFTPGKLGKWGRFKDIFLPRKSPTSPRWRKDDTYGLPVGMRGSIKDRITKIPAGERAGYNVGAFMRTNPVTSFGIASMVPQAGYLGYKGAKAAPGTIWEGTKRWADAVIPGDQSRWWKDKPPAKKEKVTSGAAPGTSGAPGGGDPNMRGDGSWFDAQAEKEAKIAKQKEWNARIKKYRDIMDIKGMNKEAAYKSLVDASKLIQESQDFKGDIRSGKLINQVIQAASKQFDKPSKTSDAINTLILQNELKKDLSAETDALDKAYKQSAIALNEKKLAGESLSETINAAYQRTGQFPSGATLAGVARTKGIDAQVLPTKDIPKDTEALDYIVSIVTESHTNPEKAPFPPGDYVIKDRLITIDETGKVTPLI